LPVTERVRSERPNQISASVATTLRSQKAIEFKTERLRKGQPLRVLDLFSGAGGMSLGFQAAGFEILAGLEQDPDAAKTHATNFHGLHAGRFDELSKARDITSTEPREFLKALYPDEDPTLLVDVVIGGPPCQAFARVGRAKLREIASDELAYKNDSRARLYTSFLHYVKELAPLLVVMENVPDLLNYGGHNLGEEICETLEEQGYTARYTFLNAAHFGVPQMRERVFLVATAAPLGLTPSFPEPTHALRLPTGYGGARRVALKTIPSELQSALFGDSHFVPPDPAPVGLPPAVGAREAIADLPPITAHLTGGLRRGARRFTDVVAYSSDLAGTGFARLMRTWPGFENEVGIKDHVIRHLPRDYAIFKRMRPGDQYPQAFEVAETMFKERLRRLGRAGGAPRPGTVAYKRLKATIVPPYDPGKFPNKWRKLEPDMPARTLMAHLGKDSYSHIHFDDEQARTISVREAARLQSFPDGFVFSGTMNPAFRQIGNAVPPLLARQLAVHLRAQLNSVASRRERAAV
jgi:DNA (cytosine-5)-methyltransferase 1